MRNLNKDELRSLSIILALAVIIRVVFMFLNKSVSLINIGIMGCILINIFIIYKISMRVTRKNKLASLLPALILAVIPLWPDITLNNQIAQLLLALSSIFFMLSLYSMLDLKWIKFGVFFPIIATILHPSAAILIPTYIGYFILSVLEHHKISKKEIIHATLSTIFIILISFFSIKISSLKLQFPIFEELKHVMGLVPLYLGLIGAYSGFRRNNKKSLLLISAGGSALLILFFKIIVFESLLLYIGMSFAALSSLMIKELQGLFKVSRVKKHSKKYILYIFVAVGLSSIFLWI